MSSLLIITAAVYCGFWVRRLGCYMNNLTNSRNVLGCYMNNSTNSSKVDDKSDDSYKKLDGEIPFSFDHEDRFTELPDEILSYILTHLSLRDVVRMTTLSKRWKNIRSLLPNLDLEWQVMSGHKGPVHEDACDLYRQAYVTRVNKILQEYDNQDISSIRISFCFTKEYASHVGHWISFASKKRLESLTLKFVCIDSYASICKLHLQKHLRPEVMYTITSSCLSQFPSLKDLRLDVCILKLDNDLRLNKLVRMDLYRVVIEGDQSQWIFSNSSTIEWLRFRNCNLPEKLCFGDKLQRLRSLMITDLSGLLEIELNAKSLKFFSYVGCQAIKLSFSSAENLDSCNVFMLTKDYKVAELVFRDMATTLPSLETLCLQGLHPLLHVLPAHPSTLFRSVVRLSLFFDDEDPEVDMVKSFPCLLNSFPQLQKLYLKVPPALHPIRYPRRYELPNVCVNTSLKEVELGNFKMDWIPCASYFLKSAVVLDRMMISCHEICYTRLGEWKKEGRCFSQQECDDIRFALRGIAVSPNADLIIR